MNVYVVVDVYCEYYDSEDQSIEIERYEPIAVFESKTDAEAYAYKYSTYRVEECPLVPAGQKSS